MYKHLYRSRSQRVIGGVFGGFGEYFNVDPVLVRLIGLLVILATGFFPGLIVYIVALLIIPLAPETKVYDA